MDFAWVQRDFVMLEVGKVTSLVGEPELLPHSQGAALTVSEESHEIRFRVDQPLAVLWIPVSLPFFGFALICVVLAACLAYACMHGEFNDWSGLLWTAGAVSFAFIFSAIGWYFLEKGFPTWMGRLVHFKLKPHGIHFGEYWSSSLLGRMMREWSDIHSVECSNTISPADVAKWRLPPGSSIIIDFKSGGSALLEVDRMKRHDVEELFLSIERNTGQSVLSKKALLLERGLMAVDNAIPVSYTSIWTDSLDSQFAATHFEPLRTTQTLQGGRYEVRMQLASGGLSAVYLGQLASKEKVILKESVLPLDTDERTRKKAKELFEREGRLLSRLNHPQIAKVMDFFVENGRDYIVLQYIPGESLRQRICSSTSIVNHHQIADWSLQIAEILSHLHSLEPPIIHRDLTPDNLLIHESGSLRLIDFGVSNEFVSKATGTLVGKQAFIPPEQFRGKSEPKSDVYAFGATLHFLLTGEDPEPLTMSCPVGEGYEIPPALDRLVTRCTDLEPDNRPSAAELVEICKDVVKEIGGEK